MTILTTNIPLPTAQIDPSQSGGLDFLWLEVTNKCNLRCVHCYAESGPHSPLTEGLTVSHYIEILDEAYALGCRNVQFIGGEPLLYPNLIDLIAHAYHKSYEFIEVYTNATLITDKLCQLFVQFGVKLAISMYASQSSVHEAITNRSGSFDRTIAAMRLAVEYQIPVRVGIILMEENKDVAAATERYLRSLGVLNIGIDRMRGIGRGLSRIPDSSPIDELCGACWNGKLAITPNGDVFHVYFLDSIKLEI